MKKILVINGHPVKSSYCSELVKAYVQGSESGKNSLETIHLNEMDFNPNLKFGYNKRMQQEEDIEKAINQIKESDHIVWVFPLWWHGMPALLKGFIDRTFLPDIAFKNGNGKLPEKLLKGKSARIIMTCDTPKWYNYLYLKNPAVNQLKKGVFGYCGIKPVRVTYINPIRNSSDEFRKKWIDKINLLGQYGK